MTKSKGTVVFFSMDALGHIHPILSIVKELKRRQYRAIILTTRPLNGKDRLESLGFELAHCYENDGKQSSNGINKSSEEALAKIMMPLIDNFRRGCVAAYEAAYRIDGAVGKHLDDMIEHHQLIENKLKLLKPDLIVYDHVIGIPCVTTVAPKWVRVYSGFPSAIYSALNDNCCAGLGLRPDSDEMTTEWKEFEYRNKKTLREKVRNFWKSHDQPDWPLELDLTPTSPYLNIYFGPQELGLEKVGKFKPLPESIWMRLEHTIEEDADEEEGEFRLPDEIANKKGKLIYFSLGTLVTCDTEMINRLLAILSKSPHRFIVSMGQMHKQIHLYENMWGERFLNQKAILKQVDLFITHGGHNSIIEAFYYAVPGLIVLPVFADQFDSAQRVQDCGFGYRLNPFNCTEEDLLKKIDLLLANVELSERMKAISLRLRSIKYHELAADRLEHLIEASQ